MKNSGFGGDKYYLVKGHTTMATIQLNTLSKEQQTQLILSASLRDDGITSAGSLTASQISTLKASLSTSREFTQDLEKATSIAPNMTLAQWDKGSAFVGGPSLVENISKVLSNDGKNVVVVDSNTTLTQLLQASRATEAAYEKIIASGKITTEATNPLSTNSAPISTSPSPIPRSSNPTSTNTNTQSTSSSGSSGGGIAAALLATGAVVSLFSSTTSTKTAPENINPSTETSTTTSNTDTGPAKEQQTPESQSDTRIVGTPYDDDGNLNPGWTLDEFNNPVKTDANFVEPATQASAAQSRAAAAAPQPVAFSSAPDWRFRIKLAPQSDYLYNAPNPGILAPLKGKGVIFPYTPTISVAYTAKYDTNAIAHSNYNVYTYQGSAVENITVTGDFTAQDITEANYMLAVIHFCRSATKMFYGQDKNRGVPPPLLYLSGLGEYQFDNHPVVLTNFTYTLPQDVDYINAYPNGGTTGINGASLTPFQQPGFGRELGAIGGAINSVMRLFGAGLTTRGTPTSQGAAQNTVSSAGMTRVPTKLSISLTFNPMITRYAQSNKFSLTDYANGKLLQGSKNAGFGGGMW